MQLRTITRISAVLAVVLGITGGALMALSPAGAIEQDRVVLDHAGETKIDYPAIIGDHPGSQDPVDLLSPDTCAAVGCDYIPVTIKTPSNLKPNGDWFVQITLAWDTQQVNDVPLEGSLDSDDLDLWIAGDPIVEDAGPNQDGFTYYSAGTSQPEQVTMYQPAGDWSFYVVNATGVNTGYSITYKVITDDIPSTIFESLPPAFTGGSAYLGASPTTVPAPSTFDAGPPPTVDIKPATPPAPDTAFTSTGPGDHPSLDDQLAAPPVKFKPASVSHPAPPSNLAILFWMIAFPFALLAISGAILLRKQRSLLSV